VPDLDAVVVGSGPNGLAAAITLAEAGLSVRVIEGAPTAGGGCRTDDSTFPGVRYDVCSAVHPLALASPFFRHLDLPGRGLTLLQPEVAFAHPIGGDRAGAALPSVDDTAAGLGSDGEAWRGLFGPLVRNADPIVAAVLAPMRGVPDHPLAAARFGPPAVRSAAGLARRFHTEEARGLIAGVAAHGMRPLNRPATGGFGGLLALLAQSVGWPLVEGGSQRITDLLVELLEKYGGTVETGHWVRSLDELPPAKATLLDVSPAALLEMAGDRLSPSYRRSLERYKYGPGICKVDWVLSGPVPWTAEACRRAGTVHVGGTFEQVARSEAEVAKGQHPESPYVLAVQPSVVDPTRAPSGQHVLWAYCHVPNGSTVDMTERIEAQLERFAPGFRDLVVHRATRTAADEAQMNPNYVGGDINVGAATLWQTLVRPTPRWNNYRTPVRGLYLCSSATPPGGGVHGMCGNFAARSAIHDVFGGPRPN
jgi:phytoene dehydrogenase-like protein